MDIPSPFLPSPSCTPQCSRKPRSDGAHRGYEGRSEQSFQSDKGPVRETSVGSQAGPLAWGHGGSGCCTRPLRAPARSGAGQSHGSAACSCPCAASPASSSCLHPEPETHQTKKSATRINRPSVDETGEGDRQPRACGDTDGPADPSGLHRAISLPAGSANPGLVSPGCEDGCYG